MTEGPSEERFADDERRYRLDSRIATGGMGEVWRATDTTLGREVAVKLLKNEYADDETFRSRFSSEAQHAAMLHHHNVAAVYDAGESSSGSDGGGPRPFLVMELVDGQPLSALIRPGQPLDPEVTRDLMAQAADAIGAAHAAGIIHRDVKPANLLVTPDGQVKITDFGIARAAEGMALTQTGQVMGTPQYLSPEQAQGLTASPASDVYSLGVVTFECLTARRPFVGETPIATALAHLREPVPPLPDFVPADLAAVVTRALAKKPADRFDDGTAYAAALRNPGAVAPVAIAAAAPVPAGETTQVLSAVPPAAAAAGPVALATPGEPPPDQRRRGFPWVPVLLVLLLVAAIVVIAAIALGGEGDEDPTDDPTSSQTKRDRGPRTPEDSPTEEPTTQEPSPTEEPTTEEPTPSEEPTQTPSETLEPSVEPTQTAEPTPSETPTTGTGAEPPVEEPTESPATTEEEAP